MAENPLSRRRHWTSSLPDESSRVRPQQSRVNPDNCGESQILGGTQTMRESNDNARQATEEAEDDVLRTKEENGAVRLEGSSGSIETFSARASSEGDEYVPRSASTSSTCLCSALRDEFQCPICLDILFRPVTLLCGHTFDQQCCVNLLLAQDSETDKQHDRRVSGDQRATALKRVARCPLCRTFCIDSSVLIQKPNTILEKLLQQRFPQDTSRRESAFGRKSVFSWDEGEHQGCGTPPAEAEAAREEGVDGLRRRQRVSSRDSNSGTSFALADRRATSSPLDPEGRGQEASQAQGDADTARVLPFFPSSALLFVLFLVFVFFACFCFSVLWALVTDSEAQRLLQQLLRAAGDDLAALWDAVEIGGFVLQLL